MTTEVRTFVGKTGTQVYGSWAGFHIDHPHPLGYPQEFDEAIVCWAGCALRRSRADCGTYSLAGIGLGGQATALGAPGPESWGRAW